MLEELVWWEAFSGTFLAGKFRRENFDGRFAVGIDHPRVLLDYCYIQTGTLAPNKKKRRNTTVDVPTSRPSLPCPRVRVVYVRGHPFYSPRTFSSTLERL